MKKEILICWCIILSIGVLGSNIVIKNLNKISKNHEEIVSHEKITDIQHKQEIAQINYSTENAKNAILIAFTIGFIMTILITIYLFQALKRKVDFLLKGVKEVSEGNLDYIIPIKNKDEFGSLSLAFNKMSQILKDKNNEIEVNDKKLQEMNKLLIKLSKNLEEKVNVRTEEIESIMQTMGDGLFTVNIDQRIIYFNKAAEEICGYKKEEVVNKTCFEVLKCPNCNANCEFLLSSLAIPEKCRVIKETYIINKNGKKIPIIKDAIILKNKNNYNIGAVEVFRDITKIKELEQMKNDFIAMITHDLKSPLTSILGFSNICLKKSNNDKVVQDTLNRIQSNGYRMLNLIENFLTISKLEFGEEETNIKELDLVKLLKDIIRDITPQAENKELTIQTSIEEKLPNILADEMQIERVFHNVFSNAVKYSLKGHSKYIFMDAKKDDDFIKVSVKDQGIGIPSEDINNIFEKYKRSSVTGKIKGTGLGLFIVKTFVEANKGSVFMESKLGEWTEVTIKFPKYKEV